MSMNCNSLQKKLGYVRDVAGNGAAVDVTMSSTAMDLIITTVIGGILWVLASAVGLI